MSPGEGGQLVEARKIQTTQWAATMGYGYYDRYDGSSEDSCDCCGGDGCEECDDQFEEQLVQCRGITQRGTRCQITSDSVHGQRNKFADAAEPLTCGSHYCTFHTEQEYERDECGECGGEGCAECCLECEGEGCEECEGCDIEPLPGLLRPTHATSAATQQAQQQQQQQQQQYWQQVFAAGLAATSAAIPAAPSQDEVAIVGYRSRQERDAEARRHAIDVDSESETTPGKRPACAAKVAARPAAKPAAKLIAKPAARPAAKPAAKLIAKPAAKQNARPAAKLCAKPAAKPAAEPAAKLAARQVAKPVAKPAARPATRLAARLA